MNSKEELTQLCYNFLENKVDIKDHLIYKKRLKEELIHIDVQEEYQYFIDLYNSNKKYDTNEHNLIVPWLLGVCNDFNINQESSYKMGELPDVDIDFLPIVRDYLKNEWAVKEFGREFVCNIGNYGTFGLKSSLIDMARVHGYDRNEIIKITKQLSLKDEDGNSLSFEKALELYPELDQYCKKYPDVALSVQKIMNRNRSMGRHAGGLIISSVPISDFVPLAKNAKDDTCASSWVEGLSGQDLGPVGLIKMDLLVIDVLYQLAYACKLVKERHNLKSISAKEGEWDWSDNSYQNDPNCLALAANGDLKGIFQFDSDGIRNLAKKSVVSSFDDLVTLNALYRPGCLLMKMDQTFIKRKLGEEEYKTHPLLEPYLKKTYGVMVFQEQIMQILHAAGDIPLRDCYQVIKAISKKKVSAFKKHKEKFIENGQVKLGVSKEEIEKLFEQIQAFSEYGFNKTLTEDTIINYEFGSKKIKDFKKGERIYCVNEKGEQVLTSILAIHDHGILNVVEATFSDGYKVNCTLDHKFLTKQGQLPLWKIYRDNLDVLCSPIGEQNASKKTNKNSLWNSFRKLYKSNNSSENMFGMQSFSMEKHKRYKIYFSLRNRIFAFATNGRSSQKLSKMYNNKEAKYSKKNGKAKFGQFVSRKKSNFFYYCKKNICKKRHSDSKIKTIKKMEGRKSRKIFEMYRSCTKVFKKIKNGKLVESFFKLVKQVYSMWRRQKTCRFGTSKNLDRSRWSVSFLANKKEKISERSQSFICSKKRQYAQGRSFEKKRYFTNSFKFKLFQKQNRRDDRRLEEDIFGHAKIKKNRHLLSRKVLRIVPLGKRQCYDLEVSCSTHNFILPTGIITSNSHAASYTMLGARQLYLKTYYPLEFYCSLLCTEKSEEKAKEYSVDAFKKGIIVHNLDLNISKVNYTIHKKDIYTGFLNIKGIGEETAERIVKNQPYSDFFDFLNRFGTDAKVLKPLISLNVFQDDTKENLYKYWLKFCYLSKKIKSKEKRTANNLIKVMQKLKSLFPENVHDKLQANSKWVSNYIKSTIDKLGNKFTDRQKQFLLELKKVHGSLVKIENNSMNIICFNKEDLEKVQDEEIDIDNSFISDLNNEMICELKYYGFVWKTNIQKSSDYTGATLDKAREAYDRGSEIALVECEIESIEKRKTKKDSYFYQVTILDGNAESAKVNVWIDDYQIFKEELKKGNLIKIQLKGPSNGFPTFSLKSLPWDVKKFKKHTKSSDFRIVEMSKNE